MISREQQFAEKLHGYNASAYAGRDNSRVRDLVDLLLPMQTKRNDETAPPAGEHRTNPPRTEGPILFRMIFRRHPNEPGFRSWQTSAVSNLIWD